jgi:hypothetical protein
MILLTVEGDEKYLISVIFQGLPEKSVVVGGTTFQSPTGIFLSKTIITPAKVL